MWPQATYKSKHVRRNVTVSSVLTIACLFVTFVLFKHVYRTLSGWLHPAQDLLFQKEVQPENRLKRNNWVDFPELKQVTRPLKHKRAGPNSTDVSDWHVRDGVAGW